MLPFRSFFLPFQVKYTHTHISRSSSSASVHNQKQKLLFQHSFAGWLTDWLADEDEEILLSFMFSQVETDG